MPTKTGRYYWEDIMDRLQSITIGEISHILTVKFKEDTSPDMIEDFLNGAMMRVDDLKKKMHYEGAIARFDKRQHYAYKIILELEATTKAGEIIMSQTRTILDVGYKISFFPLFGNPRNKKTFIVEKAIKKQRRG